MKIISCEERYVITPLICDIIICISRVWHYSLFITAYFHLGGKSKHLEYVIYGNEGIFYVLFLFHFFLGYITETKVHKQGRIILIKYKSLRPANEILNDP